MLVSFKEFEKLYESRTPEFVYGKNKNVVSADGIPIEEKDIQVIFDADPSTHKSYVNWLIQLYSREERSVFFEDLYKATDYLSIYDLAKRNNRIKDERSKNIFNVKTLPELYRIVEPFMEDETEILSNKQKRGATPVDGQFDIIYEDDNWEVVIPKTHPAACYWGKGTRWCTAVDANPTMFNNYTKQGPLYIFRHKNNANERYQLHLESKQFMDKADSPYSPETFFNNNPELKNALSDYWSNNKNVLESSKMNPLESVLDKNVKTGWSIFVYMIVDSGFNLDFIDSHGDTALINCCKKHDVELIKFLCEKGADPLKPNKLGTTPVVAAISTTPSSFQNKKTLSISELDQLTLEIVKILFDYGADASGKNLNGTGNSVSEAILQNKIQTALFLVDKPGYDPNSSDSRSGFVKNLALYLPRLSVTKIGSETSMSFEQAGYFIQTLIDNGLNLNIRSSDEIGDTPLHLLSYFATLCSRDKNALQSILFMTNIILENGADPWLEDRSADTTASKSDRNLLPIEKPFGIAKNAEMVNLLTKYMKQSRPNGEIPPVDIA
jgi:ankyrin repeat protein